MEKLLRDFPHFVEVAKHKSFTLAAEALDVPISTLSRRIAAFERELGVTLFKRSTRNVELTESGQEFYERCSYILAEAEVARDALVRDLKSPAGRIRVAVNPDLFYTYLRGVFSDFAAQYPDIRMHVHFSTRWVDLLTEPYDLDFRIGDLPDSSLKARRLLWGAPGLYISPKLLEFYPKPESPEDLADIPCITYSGQGGAWTLTDGKQTETVLVKSAHEVNSLGLGMDFAMAGLGVTWLAPPLTYFFEDNHELVQILPGWSAPRIGLSVVMAPGQLPHRVRLLVDHLVAYFESLGGKAPRII